MPLTLHPVPASMVGFAEKIMDLPKRILSSVHGSVEKERLSSVPIFPAEILHSQRISTQDFKAKGFIRSAKF